MTKKILIVDDEADMRDMLESYFDRNGYSAKVKQGSKVKAGELLLEMDLEQIQKAGYSIDTPLIILNSEEYKEIVPIDASSVEHGQVMITLNPNP